MKTEQLPATRRRRSAPRPPAGTAPARHQAAPPGSAGGHTGVRAGAHARARRLSSFWTRRFGPATTLYLVAIISWIALGTIVYFVDPSEVLARTAFFVVLFTALFCSLLPLLYRIALRYSRSRLYQVTAGKHAARQASMVAGFIVLNGVLQVQGAWSELTALLLLSVFGVVEIVALARR